MILCKLGHTVLALFIVSTIAPAWSQMGGDQLAGELNKLRQQQRQLERDIGQYQQSIALLRSNDAELGEDSSALQTLETQLGQTQANLVALTKREAALLQQLRPGGAQPAARAVLPADPDAAEVARLKILLANHYDAQARAAEEQLASERESAAVIAASGPVPADKVRLSGPEGIAAIQQINERLSDPVAMAQRREPDIIYHVEIRRDASLVSSSTHSLKSLGNSQFVSKVSLAGGTATVTVRKDTWMLDLDGQEASDYLVVLNLSGDGDPELHVIPVRELQETRWTEIPPWLPYTGTNPPAPTGS